jgi:hypothetical protein
MKLNSIALQQAIRTLFAGAVATLIIYFWPESQSNWVLLSALLIVQIRLTVPWFKQIVWQLITAVIAVIFILLSSSLAPSFWVLAVYLALVSFALAYYGFKKSSLFLPFFLINLWVLVASGIPVSGQETISRAECILIGAAIAMLVTVSLWPATLKREANTALAMCLETCKQLVIVIFDIYLRRDYAEKHLYYEKEIYELCQQFFYYKKTLTGSHLAVDAIFEIILSLSSLRYRVKDYSTFEIIHDELKATSQILIQKLTSVPEESNELLQVSIEQLESAYESTLKVAAKEPLVFLFFIFNLKALALSLSE